MKLPLVTLGRPVLAGLTSACPYPGCLYQGGNIQCHFRTHVQCHEVCVFCVKTCTSVALFVRHSQEHNADKDEVKTAYMAAISKRLCSVAAAQYEHYIGCLTNPSITVLATSPSDTADTTPRPSSLVDHSHLLNWSPVGTEQLNSWQAHHVDSTTTHKYLPRIWSSQVSWVPKAKQGFSTRFHKSKPVSLIAVTFLASWKFPRVFDAI
jgi:hypothetical protein